MQESHPEGPPLECFPGDQEWLTMYINLESSHPLVSPPQMKKWSLGSDCLQLLYS